jgi:ADP-heptose:LPS heptosyltransferase
MNKKKILVVALGRIGDLVLITPIFPALKQDNPEHEVHVLAGRNNYKTIAHHPFIDKLHVYRKRPLDTLKLLYKLRKERYELWIDPKDHPSSESRLFVRLCNPPTSVGFNDSKHRLFSHSVTGAAEHYGVHLTLRALRALEPLGIRSTNSRPVLAVDEASSRSLREFLTRNKMDSYCYVNISATDPARHWTTEHWIAFIKVLEEEGRDVVLCCTPADDAHGRAILAATKNTVLYRTPSIEYVLAAVHAAELVVTVDTSIVHIASAFNKPILSLHANMYREYSKYRPLSDIAHMAMAPCENALVPEIPFALVLDGYRAVRQRMDAQKQGTV